MDTQYLSDSFWWIEFHAQCKLYVLCVSWKTIKITYNNFSVWTARETNFMYVRFYDGSFRQKAVCQLRSGKHVVPIQRTGRQQPAYSIRWVLLLIFIIICKN